MVLAREVIEEGSHGLRYGPEYGGDVLRHGRPAFEWRDENGRFVSTDSGIGWNLSPHKDTQYGLRLWPQLGRHGGDVPAGIGAVGPRLQAEAFATHAPFEALLLQSGLLLGAGQHHDGAQVELGLTSGLPIGQDLLGIGLSWTWANGPYRRSYFGISPLQSAARDNGWRPLRSGTTSEPATRAVAPGSAHRRCRRRDLALGDRTHAG